MKPPLELDDIRKQLLTLHGEVGKLTTDVFKFNVSWTVAVFWRRPLRKFETRLDTHFTKFMELDTDLMAHANPPTTLNAAETLVAAKFSLYFGIRDSVRDLLSATNAAIGSLRNQADFRGSLALAVLAIVLAAVSAFVDITVLKSASP